MVARAYKNSRSSRLVEGVPGITWEVGPHCIAYRVRASNLLYLEDFAYTIGSVPVPIQQEELLAPQPDFHLIPCVIDD